MVSARLEPALSKAARSRGSIVLPYLLVDRHRASRTRAIARAVREAGGEGIELGFPFSDPLADGPVLAHASNRALQNGTRWSDLLRACRESSSELPTAVMTYANPLFHRGIDAALGAIADAGASGLIVPDLDLEDSQPWRTAARAHGLALVLLVAPSTPVGRVDEVARHSRGFLYVVGRYGTTGAETRSEGTRELIRVLRTARASRPDLPVLVGFGVRDAPTTRGWIAAGAQGVIVGSAFESAIGVAGDPGRARGFLTPIVAAARPR